MGYRFNPLPWRFDRVEGGTPAGDVETLTGDTGGAVGPDGAFNINVLGGSGISVAGNPGTNTLTINSEGGITPYFVCAGGGAPYTTIQSALDAADAAGGGIVYVCPGTYTENLTLYGTTQVVGVPGNSDAATVGNTVIIDGVHTPPTTGSFAFKSIYLQSATHIFSSAAAGSAELLLENCLVNCTNGFTFNVANWTGPLVVYNVGEDSTNNGVVNNSGGSTCFFISGTMGAGSGQTMVTSGNVTLQEIDLNCPWDAQTGSALAVDYTLFTQSVTLSNDSSGIFSKCRWNSGATTPITMSSSGNFDIVDCVFDTSADPYLSGAGSGSIILKNATILDNQQIGPSVITPNLRYEIEGTGLTINTGVSDIITYELRDVAAVYQFTVQIAGIASTGNGAGVRLIGTIKTNGASATVVETVDQVMNKDLVVAGASATVIASGNNLIVRATGSLGAIIHWNCSLTFKQITL